MSENFINTDSLKHFGNQLKIFKNMSKNIQKFYKYFFYVYLFNNIVYNIYKTSYIFQKDLKILENIYIFKKIKKLFTKFKKDI